MTIILTGCSLERATALAARLLRGGAVTFDPLKGEGVQFFHENSGSVLTSPENHGITSPVGGLCRFSGTMDSRAAGDPTPQSPSFSPCGPFESHPPRRKLRRIGGSDRLWRALRGGR